MHSSQCLPSGLPRLREINWQHLVDVHDLAFQKASLRCTREVHCSAISRGRTLHWWRSSTASCAGVRSFETTQRAGQKSEQSPAGLESAYSGKCFLQPRGVRPSTNAFAPFTMVWLRPSDMVCSSSTSVSACGSGVFHLQMTKHDRPLSASNGDETQES